MKTFDEIAAGKLQVSVTEYNPATKQNNPAKTTVVTGIDAAKKWLEENGRSFSLKANSEGATISGWTVYRFFRELGHRSVGAVTPL